jgi:hypothetical protein
MSYQVTRKRQTEVVVDEQPIDYRCPAHGCPNAASLSFDNGKKWACYFHAKEEFKKWDEVTDEIRAGWPATCNWNHPAKVAYEEEQAAKRRAKLPQRKGLFAISGLD